MNKLFKCALFSCFMFAVVGCDSGNNCDSNNSTINQLPFAWAESPVAFTNVAHKACDAIREIENPTSQSNVTPFVTLDLLQGAW